MFSAASDAQVSVGNLQSLKLALPRAVLDDVHDEGGVSQLLVNFWRW